MYTKLPADIPYMLLQNVYVWGGLQIRYWKKTI